MTSKTYFETYSKKKTPSETEQSSPLNRSQFNLGQAKLARPEQDTDFVVNSIVNKSKCLVEHCSLC